MKLRDSRIEVLEARIAPASVAHLRIAAGNGFPGGEILTFTSSLGTLAVSGVNENISVTGLPGGLPYAQIVVNLSDSSFNGTNFSVTLTKGPHDATQLANVEINAGTNNLSSVSIAGDLGSIMAGSGSSATPAIKSLTVNSIGRFEGDTGATSAETSTITGSVTKLVVKGNVDGTFFDVSQNIGSISIGGSLIGGGSNFQEDGDIFAGVNIGKVFIAHDVRGGENNYDGIIAAADDLGAVTIGGSIYGGDGYESASIGAGANVASVAVGGSVIGGAGQYSGNIYGGYFADGTIGKIILGGSLVGGSGDESGLLGFSNGGVHSDSLTTVVVGKDIIGGAGSASGSVVANTGSTTGSITASIGSLTLKGSLIGGSNSNPNGYIASSGQVESISIKGSLYGGSDGESADILALAGINKLGIGGSIYGGDGYESALVLCVDTIGVLTIGGDVFGGGGANSGVVSTAAVTTEHIGGIVVLGSGTGSGTVTA